jgi:hypothetical protein
MSEPRVAALYVDPRGPYPSMPGVDCWTIERNACLYNGPAPVVAHPPCGPWGSLKHLSRTEDSLCAVRAVFQVRKWRGVLEQPAQSRLWPHCQLPEPEGFPDQWGGYSIEVTQVSWGHVARKRTWLYLVGIDRAVVEATRRDGGEPTHWVSGGRVPRKGRGIVPPGIKVCSPRQRRRTPPAFARWLVELAASAA